MRFPFQIEKTFSTSLSKEDIIVFVKERLNRKTNGFLFTTNDYIGSIENGDFNFHKSFNSKTGPIYPKIAGNFLNDNPTKVKIKISPNYLRIFFFMTFPSVFIPSAIFFDQMTINGILREPELIERISVGLFGGIGPMIWCYFDSIRPIKKTEKWIIKKLKLNEI